MKIVSQNQAIGASRAARTKKEYRVAAAEGPDCGDRYPKKKEPRAARNAE